MATGNDELEQFKTQINLCEYAQSNGFQLDRKQSSRASAVMRHVCGDKIVIARRPSGHWVYFNVHGNDSGSIIDFVASRKSLSLGSIRKELRPWVNGGGGVNAAEPDQMFPKSSLEQFQLVPSTPDIERVSYEWSLSRAIASIDAYLPSRGICQAIIDDPVFENRIRVDRRGNCIFPHWSREEILCGFEIKNNGFTGFSPGGEKGLWCSRPRSTDTIMVVCESAIDALSIAAIYDTTDKRFFSTAGTCSPRQVQSLLSASSQMNAGTTIWLAFDNDDGGRHMASELRSNLLNEKVVLKIIDKLPVLPGQDWNDVLQENKHTRGQYSVTSDTDFDCDR